MTDRAIDWAERLEAVPISPGVYLFKSRRGAVLYVGKAQNLRQRVRQYVSGGDGRIRIPALMDRAADVDVLVTASVKDALLLENELIKRHKPPFNVRLRDDKQYLALRLDPREDWPRLTMVRQFKKDGAQYFGPYTSSVAMKEAISNLRKVFPLRSCSDSVFRDYQRRGRPCIEFEMKRCVAPCCHRVEPAEYAELVDGTQLFLRGKSAELVDDLRLRMAEAARAEAFEEAARLRDRVAAVERTVERQQIVAEKPVERDVFGLVRRADEVQVQVLHVREGRVAGAEDFGFADVRLDDGEVMGSFLGQYYGAGEERVPPREVLTSIEFEDSGVLAALLSESAGRKVTVRTPQRGPAREIVAMASANAEIALARQIEARESVMSALEEIRERCHLTRTPHRIECYDVSNLQGSLAVASRVVFEDGKPVKNDYRKYRIREAAAGDDFDCLREVMRRRLGKVEREPLPDLLMVDGGRGQLGVVSAALADAELEVDVLGIAKERDDDSPSTRVRRGGGLKAERLFLAGRTNPVTLLPSSKGLLLLQRVRDESHRFAIEFQRSLRQKVGLTSILEEIPGVGPGKRKSLLRHLGSLRAVREADVEILTGVPGVSANDARTIRDFFDRLDRPVATAEPPEDAGPEDAWPDGARSGEDAEAGEKTAFTGNPPADPPQSD